MHFLLCISSYTREVDRAIIVLLKVSARHEVESSCSNALATALEHAAAIGIVLLPLLCWPNLAAPFSAPKMWLVAVVAALVLAVALARWNAPGAEEPAGAGTLWPWLAWLAALGVTALFASYASLEALALAALPLPLAWGLARGVLNARTVRSAILIGSAAEAVIALLQYAGADPLALLGWRAEVFPARRMRVYGTLGNPDYVAAWLCATLPLALPRAGERDRKRTAFAWSLFVLQLAAIVVTGSRVFLLAVPAALLALLLRRASPLRAWAVVPAGILLLFLSPARPIRFTVEGRLYLARLTASHWPEIPFTGFGPGSFVVKFPDWQAGWLRRHPRDARFAGVADHAHNDYLEYAVEYGPMGLCAFLAACAALLARAWYRPDAPESGRAPVWAAAAALFAVALVDFPFHRPAEWALSWLLLGLLAAPARAWNVPAGGEGILHQKTRKSNRPGATHGRVPAAMVTSIKENP